MSQRSKSSVVKQRVANSRAASKKMTRSGNKVVTGLRSAARTTSKTSR